MFLILFVLLFSISAYAQTGYFNYENELRNTDATEFRKKVELIIRSNPGTAQALFLSALLENDAEKSVQGYTKVITQFPKSEYAANALFKLGQYYYSRGLYVSARTNYLKLIKDFPNSTFADNAAYFAASCLCASKKMNECSEELREFIATRDDSELKNLALLDYEELKPDLRQLQQVKTTEGELAFDKTAKYTLQMGVFTKANNALNYRNYFTKLNLPAVIRERKMRDKPIYFVLLGSFPDKETAEKTGEELREKHGKPFRVVENN